MQSANLTGQQLPQPIRIHNRFLPDWLDAATLRQLFIVTMFTVCSLYLPQAAAQSVLPSGSIGIPGVANSDNWVSNMVGLFRWGLTLLLVVVLGFGIGRSILTMFSLINDARNGGEWGPAIQQIVLVLINIAFSLGLFALANKYVLEPLDKLGGGS
ncbi:MAG: hypothetical protein D8H94_07120 [Cardiobacterium sp.]|jgi:hypothetical protein|nr:MAG: hypothetical protein D8H94_07120 [Cardiobacterium sp.]